MTRDRSKKTEELARVVHPLISSALGSAGITVNASMLPACDMQAPDSADIGPLERDRYAHSIFYIQRVRKADRIKVWVRYEVDDRGKVTVNFEGKDYEIGAAGNEEVLSALVEQIKAYVIGEQLK